MSFTNLRQLAALFKPPVTEKAEEKSSVVALANKLETAKLQLKQLVADSESEIMSNESLKEMHIAIRDMNAKLANLSDSISSFSNLARKPELKEMKLSDMSSGYMKSRKAIDKVNDFVTGKETIELANGHTYKSDGAILATRLKKGMTVLASYKAYNQGVDLVEFISAIVEHNGVKTNFDSIKEALAFIGVKSLKAVPDDYDVRLEVADITDGDMGDWYYLFEGRFCRGSGAEPLSFTLAKFVE